MPSELISHAKSLGLGGIGICDRSGVYGLVRAWRASQEHGIKLLYGATLAIEGLPDVVLYARDGDGWASLCRLISCAHEGSPKGEAAIKIEQLLNDNRGLLALTTWEWTEHREAALTISDNINTYAVASRQLLTQDRQRIEAIELLAKDMNVPILASNRALQHSRDRQPLQDLLTCLRHHCTLDSAGTLLQPNGERHLKSTEEMLRLFSKRKQWVYKTAELSEQCSFTLSELSYSYPKEVVPDGHTPNSWLRELTYRGLKRRYPKGTTKKVVDQIEHELKLIKELHFPAYFLTVEDIVSDAKRRGILCQGRGSAANSAVCFALGITAVDPARSNMLFERFISKERGEPPDIDVDFEHRRREEVIQATYAKYGRGRAAMVNEVISYRARSAIRDVGKVLGLSTDQINELVKERHDHNNSTGDNHQDRVAMTMNLSRALHGFPRHVSIHTGGFVISEGSLKDRSPIEPASMADRSIIQWDKDDIDPLGFVKIDLLALGILTAIRRCFELISTHYGLELSLANVPPEDPAVYEMLSAGDSVGVFQVESRAQMSMLPRMRPKCFYDLVIEISLVRPGPIQGGMVHPYLARRNGEEPITYAHPLLKPILERTLGIPIFQEQVMEMAMAVGGFGAGEADKLRRAMGAWRKRKGLEPILKRLKEGMRERGISSKYAEQIKNQIMGFGDYGFPESHASSFALIVYVSAWLKCHYPAAFAAALINSQPMGFYSPSTLIADAKRHDVEVLPISIAKSEWECTLEITGTEALEKYALRIGLNQVAGLKKEAALSVIELRNSNKRLNSIAEITHGASLDKGSCRALARADAFSSLGINRREALWQIEGLWKGPLISALPSPNMNVELPKASSWEQMSLDYSTLGFSLRAHPIALMREKLKRSGVVTIESLSTTRPGELVRLAVIVTHRQRPSTASGVLFMGVEDETGMSNVIVWPKVYERQRKIIRDSNILIIKGRLQRNAEAISIVAFRFSKPKTDYKSQGFKSRDFK